MENEIMGSKSPLHDRQTSTLEIKPFDYYESSDFFPDYTNEQRLISYGILGGIPRYLEAFDSSKDLKTNIASKIIKEGAYLHEAPDSLLKAKLRETNTYNSILSAIAYGRNKIIEISNYIHEDKAKVSKYLSTLQTLRLVEKRVPCGENQNSRKSIYVIKDNFFRFWFRYQFTNNTYYAMLGETESADDIMRDISNLMKEAFEQICKEYLIRKAKTKDLPFIPFSIGKWWGNNPIIKAQNDVDVLAMDRSKTKAIFMECKFTATPMPYKEYEDLQIAAKAFPDIKEKHLYFVSRCGYAASVKRQAAIDGTVLLSIDDLFI